MLNTLTNYILQPENISAIQDIAIENQEHGETERLTRREQLQQDRATVSREIANITNAIANAGHSDALLKTLKTKEADLADINADFKQLDVPIEHIPRLTQLQIDTASKKLIDRLTHSPIEEKRQILRGLLKEVRTERTGKRIFALITYWYPPPFDFAPTAGIMLPIPHAPVGAHLHRQLFSHPAETK